MNLESVIRAVPDFPKPGIMFRDITPVLLQPDALKAALDGLAGLIADRRWDKLAGIESRGFLFGAPLAERFGRGMVMMRKPGKLPADTISASYALEYGEATLEIHRDAVAPGEKVMIVDDLLATGGTAAAAASLVRELGGEVAGHLFLVELEGLGGRKRLGDDPVFSLVNFPDQS